MLKTAVNISKPEHLENYVIKSTTGKRENMCFDMRVTCQPNKNINYWDLVSLAHKNTVYLNGHVICVST